MPKPPRFPIFLASTSPRRIELLRGLGLAIEVRAPDADETPRRGEAPRALVRRLASAKAESVARAPGLPPGALVIAADTIVVAPEDGRRGHGKILGKPRDAAEARRMLGLLSGRTHTVLTGYRVLRVGGDRVKAASVTRVVVSRVRIKKLAPAAVRRYVESGEPMDKAGAYAAQGIGMTLVERLGGSYTNVVGLPMAQLMADVERLTGLALFSWLGKP